MTNTSSHPRDTYTPITPADIEAQALFPTRHIGPRDEDIVAMLEAVGAGDMDSFIGEVVPGDIRFEGLLDLPAARTEYKLWHDLREIAEKNKLFRSCIGMGYVGTITPPVILRNVLENPQWYTQYTPYQPETAQGRLEALLNFQTMIADLTGLPLASSSLLDEGTAAAEAVSMVISIHRHKRMRFFVSDDCHPQTIAVVKTRAESLGVEVIVGAVDSFDLSDDTAAGVLVQYPTSDGRVECYESLTKKAHENGMMVIAAADLLSLTLLRAPGEWGADICVGSAQRFGVPMGFGGPHAGFMSTHESHVRKMPGRIVGVSRDAHGNPALRLAVQTREQHIKRDPGIFPPAPGSENGSAIGSFTVTLDPGVGDFLIDFQLVAAEPFTLETVDAVSGQTFQSSNGNLFLGSASIGILPSPGAMAVFGLGGLLASRRRR
jgi:glycine dehydrogenase